MSKQQPEPTAVDAAALQARYVLVAARFNDTVVEQLIRGARRALMEAGVDAQNVELLRVPGSFELPQAARRVVACGRADAVIALGALIRGETPHFEYIASACASGLNQVALGADIPVLFGVLTTDTAEQARQRAAASGGNKGAEVARAALEMVSLYRRLPVR